MRKWKLVIIGVLVVMTALFVVFIGCENGSTSYVGTWVGDMDGMTVTLILTESTFEALIAFDMEPMDAPVEGDFVLGMKGPLDVTEDFMSMTVTGLGAWMFDEPIDGEDGWVSEGDDEWDYLLSYDFYYFYYFLGGELELQASYRVDGDTLYVQWEGEDEEEAFTKQ